VRYLRELKVNDRVRVTLQLIDYDNKRLHYFEKMHHASEDWLAATSEQLALHVDMKTRRVAPFPDDVLMRLGEMKAAHAILPRPDDVGRAIVMPKKA
jgi:acyl-CoA thioester hydrolase